MRFFQNSFFTKRNQIEVHSAEQVGAVSMNSMVVNTFVKLTKDGLITDVGEDFYSLTGYRDQDLFLKSLFNFISPKSRQLLNDGLMQICNSNPILTLYLYIRTADEELLPIEVVLNLLPAWHDANVLAVIRNTRNEKDLLFSLSEERDNYRLLAETNSFAQVVLDQDWKCLYQNNAFIDLIGVSRDELTDSLFHDLVLLADHRKLLELINTVSYAEKEVFEIRLMGKKNSPIPVKVHMTRCINDFGQTQHLVLNILDLSVQNKYEQDLIKAQKSAEIAHRLKNSFLGLITHELRTPLNAIIGFSGILKRKEKEYSNLKFLDSIESNGYRLLDLIDNLLDFSLLENKEYKPSLANTDLQHFFERLELRQQGDQKTSAKRNVDVSCSFEVCNHCSQLFTDRHILRKVFINLIDNAVKFTHQGYVRYGCRVDEAGELLFFVEDSGIGISEENREMVFEKFCQVDQSSTREYEGSGLGLTVSKMMVELLGGKMWLVSEAGKGTAFYFQLPLS